LSGLSEAHTKPFNQCALTDARHATDTDPQGPSRIRHQSCHEVDGQLALIHAPTLD